MNLSILVASIQLIQNWGNKLRYNFEDYVEATKNVTTEEDLFASFLKAIEKHGLDRALFCLATDHTDIGQSAGTGIIHNYPSDWMNYYFEKQFDKIDPVMIYGLNQVSAYSWDIIPNKMILNQTQKNCLNFGQEAGLQNGVCTPLRGANNQLAGISLASSEKKDSFDGTLDLVTAYCNHFYISYKRLHEKDTGTIANVSLTDRERDILSWIARGKSDLDIGDILNLSEYTINYHMRNIFRKFQANSRITVVVKAVSYGLISF